MRNNIFLGLLLGVLGMFGTAMNNNRQHRIDPHHKAILRILHYRQMYMPSGAEKVKNDSLLDAITYELKGSIQDRINHLKINGVNSESRKAAILLAKQYIIGN